MDKRLCLKIARRINTLLTESLGEGVHAQRMLDEPLYARDVLLVCESLGGEEFIKLARMFRQALQEAPAAAAAAAASSHEATGIAGVLNSIFGVGPDSLHPSEHDPAAPGKLRRWFGRGDRTSATAK
jgi:hypothetical protein